jgi:PAS domain S-box-containing protein
VSLYQSPLDTITEGVVFQDAEGTVTFINAAAERILGFSRDRLREMQGWPSTGAHAEAVRKDGSPFTEDAYPARKALATGKPVENVVMGVFNHSSRQRVWIRLSVTPILLQGEDRPSHMHMIFHDITEGVMAQGPDGTEGGGP